MYGRFSMLAAAAIVASTAAPALAAESNPVGGQMGGMWTQEAPTNYFGTEMGAVLAPRVQYVTAGGGPAGVFNFRYGMGGGGEVGFGTSTTLTTPGTFASTLGAGWKQQLTRAGNMALAFNLGGSVGGLGTGTTALGATVGLPMTFDVGSALLTVHPGFTMPNVSAGTTGATVGAGIGLQAALANYWSFLGTVTPTYALAPAAPAAAAPAAAAPAAGGGFTMPIALGARMSPTALSHVDFQVGAMTVTPGFGLTVGTVGVMGHIGFR